MGSRGYLSRRLCLTGRLLWHQGYFDQHAMASMTSATFAALLSSRVWDFLLLDKSLVAFWNRSRPMCCQSRFGLPWPKWIIRHGPAQLLGWSWLCCSCFSSPCSLSTSGPRSPSRAMMFCLSTVPRTSRRRHQHVCLRCYPTPVAPKPSSPTCSSQHSNQVASTLVTLPRPSPWRLVLGFQKFVTYCVSWRKQIKLYKHE